MSERPAGGVGAAAPWQGNYGVLHKGADQNRTQRIRHPELLPPDGESVLRARPGQWGSCAVVGNRSPPPHPLLPTPLSNMLCIRCISKVNYS